MNQDYIPGVCNINTAEIAYRRKAGYVGLAIVIVGLIVLLLIGAPSWTRLLLILPAILSASGFLQAKNKFCVAYGAAGKQNASEGSDVAEDISDNSALETDKKRARQINIQSVVIGVIVGFLTVLIPA